MKFTNHAAPLQTFEIPSPVVVAPLAVTEDVDPDILSNYEVGDQPPNTTEISKWYVQLWAFRIKLLHIVIISSLGCLRCLNMRRELSFDAEGFTTSCESKLVLNYRSNR